MESANFALRISIHLFFYILQTEKSVSRQNYRDTLFFSCSI